MASRDGPMVMGTDGNDFSHRQQVASQYKVSAKTKSRLRFCIFLHFLVFLAMLIKLSADILDRLDIFILEIEELEVPKPLVWEYAWCTSILFAFVGLSAVRKNKIRSMQIYLVFTLLTAVLPISYGLVFYFGDVYEFLSSGSKKGLHIWQGYPYAVLWYAFLSVAIQVHGFSMYFAWKLVKAWRARGVKKVQ